MVSVYLLHDAQEAFAAGHIDTLSNRIIKPSMSPAGHAYDVREIHQFGLDLAEGLSGAGFLTPASWGRVIQALKKAMAAATDNQAPGIARLPVSWIR